jgi:DNA-binding transcriptional ArsR family regulator
MSRNSVSVRDTKLAKAMAHPVRVHALSILNERVASPSDIADELELPVANVAYHVRALLQLGCIEEVETRPVRGALEHRYRALRRALVKPTEWDSLPPSAREGFAVEIAETAFDGLARSLSSGGFERRPETHLSYTPLLLDEQGWAQINGRLDEVLDEAMALQAECAARIDAGETGGAAMRSHLTLMHYEAAPRDAASSNGG